MSRSLRLTSWCSAVSAGALACVQGARLLAFQPQEAFVSAKDVAQETLPAAPLVFIAYAFVWVVLLAYVFMLWRRLGRVERELADVTARLHRGKRP